MAMHAINKFIKKEAVSMHKNNLSYDANAKTLMSVPRTFV